MSGLFSNISGFFGLRFNSGRNGGYMPGGCCCNNNFGNIWGGNFGGIMPYSNSYSMFNPFEFNNFGCSNFGSMYMPTFGGCNPYGGSQFGGYGEFNNYGSQFGGYAQFGGSGYGNNGFGNFLGYLGAGLLGYTLGKQKTDKVEETTEKAQSSGNVEQKNNTQTLPEAKDAQANGNTNNTKDNTNNNSANNASGNENKQNDNIISSVPNTEVKNDEVVSTINNQIASQTSNESVVKSETNTKLNAKVGKIEEEKKSLTKEEIAKKKVKPLCITEDLVKLPRTSYDSKTETKDSAKITTGKYEGDKIFKVVENTDGSSVTYFNEDNDKRTGFEAEGWDKIIRLNKDGSGSIERKNTSEYDGREVGVFIEKYDSTKNLFERKITDEKKGITEIYTELNHYAEFDKKTVTDAKGTTVYTWDKTKKDYVKQ